MASHDDDPPPSIPLQNLARPSDLGRVDDDNNDDDERRPSFWVGEVHTPTRAHISRRGRLGSSRRYSRLAETSPGPTERISPSAQTYGGARSAVSPSSPPEEADEGEEEEDTSPLDHHGGLQEPLGFAGLILPHHDLDGSSGDPPTSTGPSRPTRADVSCRPIPRSPTDVSPASTPARRASDDMANPSFLSETDTIPLTRIRSRQPSHLSGTPSTPGPERARTSFQTVPLNEQALPGPRLGDDLWATDTEPGRSRPTSRERSESTSPRKASRSPSSAGSPLSRAGTMVRKMSQRVVNLSNEPEVVQRSIRKGSTMSQARPSLVDDPAPDRDDTDPIKSNPVEKVHPLVAPGAPPDSWQQQANPLKGKSLGIFGPNHIVRTKLADVLVHPATEPIILVLIVLQTIFLAVDSASDVYKEPRPTTWGTSWVDYSLLAFFIVYTVEIIIRVIVSGLVLNPEEYSTVNRQAGLRAAAIQKMHDMFVPRNRAKGPDRSNPLPVPQASLLRSFTAMQSNVDQPGYTRKQQRARLARRAFLRHSFNRLDFVAVVSFWIAFIIGSLGVESSNHLNVFRMLSCLRILRLLGITQGTSVILRSLKKAAPLLVNVAFLVGFFWLLFAVVGVQSFKASFRRSCVWVDPEGIQSNFTNALQFCGGHLDNVTGAPKPYLSPDGAPAALRHKGYLCPRNSLCVQQDNPYNGTVGFDNILQSLELVFVIMSSNTFSDLLYYTTQSDYLAAGLFFAAGIVFLSLWLTNLLVAVITSSFQVIREESKTSAFTGTEHETRTDDNADKDIGPQRISPIKRIFDKTRWFWVMVIVAGLLAQSCRSASMSAHRARSINTFETVVTLLLLVEIVLRFATDWRHFHQSTRNWVDLAIAIITAIIQLPPIHRSGQPYAWLTLFQILRIYRVVMAVSVTRELITLVLGSTSGILNLVVFVFLITFLGAIFAVQIFRGDIPQMGTDGKTTRVSFFTIFNSFLGMYQILSSENWTTILYNATQCLNPYGTAWIAATFLIIWFILANFIVLNMFIAVIQENFDVTEDEKRMQQIRSFLQQKELGASSPGNLSLSSILKLGRDQRQRDPLDYGPATMEMLLKDAVVRDFLDEESIPLTPQPMKSPSSETTTVPIVQPGILSRVWQRVRAPLVNREPNPFHAGLQFSNSRDELDPRVMVKEVVSATERRKRAQREYLQRHPRYNVSLFIFTPSNPIRRACQHLVGPGRGRRRAEGAEPIRLLWYSFSTFIYAAIVAMVLLACVSTPLFQKDYFRTHRFSVHNWFVYTDLGFALLFTVEAIIKVIADGCFWTPNAYFRGSWGMIDGVVLITLWIDVITSLLNQAGVSRAIGAFKALRALRLLNVSDNARETFHSVIVVGGRKVISAAFVSISFLIPFALYAVNLFNGQMQTCNDDSDSIVNLARDCVGEYSNHLYNWDVVSPRTASNPYFSFDNFGSALFILFQIVSQEGWTDVMWSAQMITGRGRQPRPFSSQVNAIYFIIFNLLGAVFVLTLFVTVFMRNYTEQTGVAFLTAEQRSWLEMRKLLRQISPSKRPSNRTNQKWRSWCYRLAIKKHGKWQRLITVILLLHLVLLVLEFYPPVWWWDLAREYLLFVFTVFYCLNIVIRIIGLTWKRYRNSSWDLFAIPAVLGTLVTTVMRLSHFQGRVADQLHKLFLVSVTLLLIPRNDQLDQLFKTAAASLPAVSNLLATWFILFLVYAIALTQTLGLTKFGGLENGNVNFRTVPKALILLFRVSCGEGWNQIMEDFATMTVPHCVHNSDLLRSDCGSAEWARALFISWNILSMYIFVSLFVSLIFESFSYVYQRSSSSSAVSREEIRRFKQAWATFDPEGTGYISKTTFPRLLAELSGIFEMRIYDGEFTVGKVLEHCRVLPDMNGSDPTSRRVVGGIDLDRLGQVVSRIPVSEIRQRRQRLNVFYEEVLVSADVDRGISFTSVLMILTHYKVINDNRSLRLEEFLRRRARLQRVEEQVRRNIVIGFFDTMHWSRQLRRVLAARSASRMRTLPNFAVPEIVVAGEDGVVSVRPRSEEVSSASGSMVSSRISRPARSQSPPMTSSLIIDTGSPSGLRHHRSESISSSTSSSPGRPSSGVDWSFLPGRRRRQRRRRWTSSDDVVVVLGRTDHPSPNRHESSNNDDDDDDDHHHHHRGHGRHATVGTNLSSVGDGLVDHGTLSRQNVLDVLDHSAWGESIRRSFTLRRSSHDD